MPEASLHGGASLCDRQPDIGNAMLPVNGGGRFVQNSQVTTSLSDRHPAGLGSLTKDTLSPSPSPAIVPLKAAKINRKK